MAGKDDAPVKDITAAEFKVREDGLAREVMRVAPAADPMSVVLLVDDSEISDRSINEIRQGVSTFIKQILGANPQNEITLVTIGDRPTIAVPASSSAATLNRAVERIFARKGAGAYVLQGITDATKILSKKESARRLIVAFDIEDGTEFSNDSHESVTIALKNAKAHALDGRAAGARTPRPLRPKRASARWCSPTSRSRAAAAARPCSRAWRSRRASRGRARS